MTVMMGKLYTALLAANVPEEKAVAAAEEAASFQNDLAKGEGRFARREMDVRRHHRDGLVARHQHLPSRRVTA